MTLQTSARQLTHSISWSIVISGLGAVAAFVSQTVLARGFGADAFGVSVYAMGWANLLQVWGAWGLSSAIARFAPGYSLTEGQQELKALVRFSYVVILLFTIAVAVAIAIGPTSALVTKISANRPWLLLVLILSTTGLDLNASALTYTGHAVVSQVIQGLVRPLAALVVAIIWPFVLPVRMDSALLIVTGSVVLAFVLSTIACIRTFGIRDFVDIGTPAQWKLWLRYSTPYIVSATAVSLISTQLDTIVVGTLLTQRDAGVYAVGASLASLVHLAPQAVERVLAPRFNAAIDLRGVEDQVARLADLVTANAISAFGSCVVVIVIAQPLLAIFGKDFSQSVLISVILAVGVLIARTGSVGASTVLQATGFQQRAALINIVVAVFAAVTSILMTRRFGLIGTAAATVVAGILRAAALSIAQHLSVELRLTRGDIAAALRRSRTQLAALQASILTR
ncbi:MAG: oligosaccharide flippase family protein [Gemmatimonadota bacterium]